jgi:hypothetical protein
LDDVFHSTDGIYRLYFSRSSHWAQAIQTSLGRYLEKQKQCYGWTTLWWHNCIIYWIYWNMMGS